MTELRKGAMSTPAKVLIGVALLFIVVALLVSVLRPSLLGFGEKAGSGIMGALGDLRGLIGGGGGG
ncbi:MAG: hypothetical protein SV186_01250 [Candidatus Nanohaloarchaea archaeon]|nr:hypothetical protein [Candidatus Nanohaloarchaea archaeon]